MKEIRIWWMPQIPCKTFYVEVKSVEEGNKIINILAQYDEFQYKNNIKPDYSSAGGMQQLTKNKNWEDIDETLN